MKAIIQYEGSMSEKCDIKSGVKQGCLLLSAAEARLWESHVAAARKRSHQWCPTPTPNNTETIERMTCHCFLQQIRRNLTSSSSTTALGPQPKECSYTPDQMDNCSTLPDWERRRRCAWPSSDTCSLMDRFSQACKDFGPIIRLKKINVLGQDVDTSPVITIDNYELDVVHQFSYLSSTSEGFAGVTTCAGWKMGAYQRTSCLASVPQARDL